MDPRPAKLLARTPVDDAHRERLLALAARAQEKAEAEGVELQYEFGPVVAFIANCQQFLRLHRGGDDPGAVELMLPDDARTLLADAGFDLLEPHGAVFRMFGWTRVAPDADGARDAHDAALLDAVGAAFDHARARGKPKL